MKIFFFLFLIVYVVTNSGCSKENIPSTPPVEQTRDYIIDRICKPWKLIRYTIGTDKQEYNYNDSAVTGHALRTLIINRDGSYTAANSEWSGSYKLLDDSVKIILTPTDPTLVAFTLNINDLTDKQVFFYTPVVAVNPDFLSSTPYESFVAYEAVNWLYLHDVNTDGIKSVWIGFNYYENSSEN